MLSMREKVSKKKMLFSFKKKASHCKVLKNVYLLGVFGLFVSGLNSSVLVTVGKKKKKKICMLPAKETSKL